MDGPHALTAVYVRGPVSYAGGVYVEDFDSMGPTGTNTPAGWFVGSICSSSGNGGITGFTVLADDGSTQPNDGENLNYGAVGSGERALGSVTGESSCARRAVEVRLVNNTAQPIEAFAVSYDGEQWRVGGGTTAQKLALLYSSNGVDFVVIGPAFDFLSPVNTGANMALDGNAPANRATNLGGVCRPAAPVPPGGTVYLRWFDANDSPVADHGLAIDNVRFEGFSLKPLLTSPMVTPSGAFQFTLVGAPGSVYDLQLTSDFTNWLTLTTISNSTGRVPILDMGATNATARFYRAQLAP
jgi:hypothetical protein